MHASVLRQMQTHTVALSNVTRVLATSRIASRCLSTVDAKPARKRLPRKSQMPYVDDRRAMLQAHEQEAAKLGLPWRIIGACGLERYPVIIDEPETWEREFSDVQEKIASAREEAFHAGIGEESKLFADATPTVEEMVASLPFTPAPRITEADKTNDRRSLERSLSQSVFLVVKRARSEQSWQFPQGQWKEGETMRQVAERVITRAIGTHKNYFIGNAPMGFHCYKYPEEMQQKRKQYGAKVFFFRAQFLSGPVQLENRLYKDYAWVTKNELPEYFDKSFAEYAYKML